MSATEATVVRQDTKRSPGRSCGSLPPSHQVQLSRGDVTASKTRQQCGRAGAKQSTTRSPSKLDAPISFALWLIYRHKIRNLNSTRTNDQAKGKSRTERAQDAAVATKSRNSAGNAVGRRRSCASGSIFNIGLEAVRCMPS